MFSQRIYLLFSFFIFSFLLLGCGAREEISLSLTAEPQERIDIGETIIVIAEGSFDEEGTSWFIDDIEHQACGKKRACSFSQDTAKIIEIKVNVEYVQSDLFSTTGDPLIATGFEQIPADIDQTITLTWK